jgi:hypothetical protein
MTKTRAFDKTDDAMRYFSMRLCKHILTKSSYVCVSGLLLSLFVTNSGFAESNVTVRNVVKQSAIGAGLGAATGYVSGESGLLRGAGLGAITGAGTGIVGSSSTLRNKPLVRSTAQGAIIGTGAAAITRKSKAKGALIGAGSGAGWHFLRSWLGN